MQAQIKAGEEEIAAGKAEALKEIKNVSATLTAEILHKLEISGVSANDIKTIINREAQ